MSESKNLPPSARFVEHVLEEQAPLTLAELVDETDLPESTTRYALDRLDDEGVLVRQPNPAQPREIQYDLE